MIFATRRTRPTTSSTFNQNFINCVPDAYVRLPSPVYDFGGDPRGFATNDEQTEITTFEARLQSPADSESRWSWLVGAFYSEEKGHTEFDSFIRGYEDTPVVRTTSAVLQYAVYYGNCARTDGTLVPRAVTTPSSTRWRCSASSATT